MEQAHLSPKTTNGVAVDIFSEVQSLVQRLAELEQDLQRLVSGQIDAVIDPDSGHIILLRQAQQALHSNEKQLRALFEAALDAIVIADDEGRYVDVNPAACELFGLPREELIGKSASDFSVPEYNAADQWRQFRQEDQPQRGIFLLRRQDGLLREAEYSAVANFLPNRHLSVLRDVTQRRQTELALRRNEERFRSLIEYSDDVILLINAEGLITYASPSVNRILGTEPGYLLNLPALFAIHPDDVAQSMWLFADLLRKPGSTVSGQVRVGPPGGPWMWIEGVCNNLLQVDTVNAVVVTFRDITARRRTESALLETTTTLQTMMQSSPLAIIAVDQERNITTWNPAAERVFGWAAHEVIGKPLPYIPADHEQEVTARIDLIFEQRKFSMYEGQRVRRDGTIVDVSVASAPILNGAEQVIGGMAIITDISEIKQMERVQDAVAYMATALRSAQTSNDMLAALVKQVSELLATTSAQASLYDMETHTLTHSVRCDQESGARVIFSPSLLDAVLFGQRPIIANDIYVDPRFGTELPENLPRAQAYIPLVVDDKAIGILQIARAHGLSEAENRLLQAVCELAASSIQRAILYETVQTALNQSNALYAVAQHLISTEDLPRLLSAVVDGAIAILAADWGYLEIFDGDEHHISKQIVGGEINGVFSTPIFARLLGQLTAEVVTRREGIIMSQANREDAAPVLFPEPAVGIGSVLITPLLYEEEILGVLTTASRVDAPELGTKDLAVLTALANQASLAIANARFVQQTREQAAQIQRVMDSVVDGLILLDPQKRILLANPAAQSMLEHYGDVSAHAELRAFAGVAIETLLSALPTGQNSREIEQKTPHLAIFEAMSHVMGNAVDGDGWLLVLRDVTEERENRQRALQQGQLAAVGQMAAGIAHDFNNIMGAIVIYSQLMKNTSKLAGKDLERLNVIHQQAQYAAELVRQLLDFSRSSVLERRLVDIVPFCKELSKLLERILPETITISFSAAKPSYRVHLDPARFQQALINMAVNARDAMPNGGRLRLHLEDIHLTSQQKPPLPDMKAGAWLSIEVADNGSGIPGPILGRIFDPFFSTKDRGKGSGLGLAQVYGIVQQHEGFIKVNSMLNEGTTFVIYLPFAEGEAPLPHPMPQASTEQERHRCILVVEDNVATRDALVDFLEINEYRVLTAKDGQDALHVFEQEGHTIDLVLSDMIMPRLGGLELFHALSELKPGIKMILMTGYPLQEDGRQLLEKGGIAWLQKPFEVEALIAMMQKLW